MKTTLLATAKERKTRFRYKNLPTDEERELAIAWLTGEITMSQACWAYKEKTSRNSGNVLYRIAIVLQDAYIKGYLKINQIHD